MFAGATIEEVLALAGNQQVVIQVLDTDLVFIAAHDGGVDMFWLDRRHVHSTILEQVCTSDLNAAVDLKG